MYLMESGRLRTDAIFDSEWNLIEKRVFDSYDAWANNEGYDIGIIDDYGMRAGETLYSESGQIPTRILDQYPVAAYIKLSRADDVSDQI